MKTAASGAVRRLGWPVTFLAAVLLIGISEAGAYRTRAEWIRDYWNRFVLSEPWLLEIPGDFKYLLLGNSIQKTGLLPTEIHESFLSLGLPGAKPISHYFLLQRYLDRHAPPQVLFLYLDPFEEQLNFNLVLRYFFNSQEYREALPDLNREEREAYLSQFIAAIDRRQEWQLKFRPKAGGSFEDFTRKLTANRGYMPAVGDADRMTAEDFDKTDASVRAHIRFSFKDRDWKYLDKILSLCREKDIRVRIGEVAFPLTAREWAIQSGFMKEYQAFLAEIRGKYPWVEVTQTPLMAVPEEQFGDVEHLNREGAERYTRFFKEEIFEPLIAEEPAS